ncbi:MAG: DUF3048 domain-containing protein [Bacteroidales bacterium]|nr:DUF3048 domain-containing protein [Lachnoclostridium sp.]MCM1383129.1 DUF3048 domain-containing protein [Lachnoclostridium sp.]MCM1465379.1 DUF3048 domain-containing protein [Bacteroidales bacterium]
MVMTMTACTRREDPVYPLFPDHTTNSTQSGAEAETDSSGSIDDPPPREGMVRSRLTNEWIEQQTAAVRPIAVMIPNEKNALPQYSLSSASILYEANVEGQMTRLMGIYEDWQSLDKIGNIRSLRSYYMYWAFEWDAIIVHVGGPFFIDELLAQPDTNNVDETSSPDRNAFYRDSDRSIPHNAYTTGSMILNIVRRKNYSLEYRSLADEQHYLFAPESAPNTLEQYGENTQNISYIDMSGCYPLTRCYFEYNESDGLYYRSQHISGDTDGPHMDAATGEQLSFKNILIQYVKCEELDFKEGYLNFQCLDTDMDGWYFTNGKCIHVTWEKTSDYGATRYYDDNGEEILLNTGKTMICIVRDGDNFSYW